MVMMKCGHVAISIDSNGNPCCPMCDCYEIENKEPILQGRKARCIYCGKIVDSSNSLPFFQYKENQKYDSFYCGCEGWD